jgi:hypothetical protein
MRDRHPTLCANPLIGGDEFTFVQSLVFHVSITESTLGALPSRVPIYLRRVGVMTCQRLRNSHPLGKCRRTIKGSPVID